MNGILPHQEPGLDDTTNDVTRSVACQQERWAFLDDLNSMHGAIETTCGPATLPPSPADLVGSVDDLKKLAVVSFDADSIRYDVARARMRNAALRALDCMQAMKLENNAACLEIAELERDRIRIEGRIAYTVEHLDCMEDVSELIAKGRSFVCSSRCCVQVIRDGIEKRSAQMTSLRLSLQSVLAMMDRVEIASCISRYPAT